jgi:hypothetical protein
MRLIMLPGLLADAALPLMWFTFPAVVLMLIPTVLIEGFLLKYWLRVRAGRALMGSLLANAASTLAGVPIATLLSYLANLALSPLMRRMLQQEHWQSPAGDVLMAIANSWYISAYVAEARWLLPVALLIILVPAFLISWGLEFWIVKLWFGRRAKDLTAASVDRIPPSDVSRAVRRANYVSYAFLFLIAATMLIRSQFSGLFFPV